MDLKYYPPCIQDCVYIWGEEIFFPHDVIRLFKCTCTQGFNLKLLKYWLKSILMIFFKPDNVSWFYFLFLLTIHCTLFTIIFFCSFLKLLCNFKCVVVVLFPLAVAKMIIVIFRIKGYGQHLTTMHLFFSTLLGRMVNFLVYI